MFLYMAKRAFLFSSLYYPNVGGVENSIKELSHVLKAGGYEVYIITSDRDAVNRCTLSARDSIFGVEVFRCRYPFSFFGFAIFLVSLFKVCKDLDILNSSLLISRSHWPVLALRALGARSVKYLVPSVYIYQERFTWRYFFSPKIFGFLVNAIGQCLAFLLSDTYVFSVDMLSQVKRAALTLSRPVLLKPGVSRDRFHAVGINERNCIRNTLGLNAELKYLLCVGRISEIKQFNVAVEALRYLDLTFNLLIVGSGPQSEELKGQVLREGVAERVHFYPFTKDVDLFYKAADVYLMTSRYESFGQVLLEATSCGLPVVGFSPSSGVRTSVLYIYKGYNHLFFPCEEQTAASLAKVVSNLDISTENFDIEVSRFAAGYSWEATVERLLVS